MPATPASPSSDPAADPSSPAAMTAICAALRAHLPEILDEWLAASREMPWLSVPEDDTLDRLPEAARALIDAALCAPGDSAVPTRRAFVHAAARHGEDRRRQDQEHDLLFHEYYLLRATLWRYVRRLAGDGDAANRAILHVDAALTLSTRAALLGFHRPEAEAADRWVASLDAIVSEAAVLSAG